MRKISRRLTALVFAVVLLMGMTIPAYAAPWAETETITVYKTTAGKTPSYLWVTLASSDENFKMSRKDVKIVKGRTGAKLVCFEKYKHTYDETETDFMYPEESYSYTGKYWNYQIEMEVKGTGTAVVNYKVAGVPYSRQINILPYKNPVKTLSLTGVSGGKNLAKATNKSADVTNLKLSKTVPAAKLKVAAKSGWVIDSVSLWEIIHNVGQTQVSYSGYDNAVTAITLPAGALSNTGVYGLRVYFRNISTGVELSTYYNIRGSKAPAPKPAK